MRTSVEARNIKLDEYIAKSGATARSAAKQFWISISTVHMFVTKQNVFGCGWIEDEITLSVTGKLYERHH